MYLFILLFCSYLFCSSVLPIKIIVVANIRINDIEKCLAFPLEIDIEKSIFNDLAQESTKDPNDKAFKLFENHCYEALKKKYKILFTALNLNYENCDKMHKSSWYMDHLFDNESVSDEHWQSIYALKSLFIYNRNVCEFGGIYDYSTETIFKKIYGKKSTAEKI